MITDTEIKKKGIQALIGELGSVGMEKFIALIQREPFDYTKWQRSLWIDQTVEALCKEAKRFREKEQEQ